MSREVRNDYNVIPIAGGADSLFRAVGHLSLDGEASSPDIRDRMVDQMASDPIRYGYGTHARDRKAIEVLRCPESFPPMCALQALADAEHLKIVVHFDAGPSISFVSLNWSDTYHVQCKGGVHFNPMTLKSQGEISIQENSSQPIAPCIANVDMADSLRVVPVSLNSSMIEWKVAQERDTILMDIRAKLNAKSRGKDISLKGSLKVFAQKFEKLSINSNGVLVFENSERKFVPVAPESELTRLATELHEVLSHAGRDKCIQVMYSKLFHPKFAAIITEVVRECVPCQLHKGKIPKKFPVYRRNVQNPYDILAIDLMELPKTRKGNKCILVGVDLCSKYGYAIPLKSKKSSAVARALESRILSSIPRTPKTILSDNGPEFRGRPFKQVLCQYGIEHENSVPYAACTNGAVERLNQTLRSRLATVSHENSLKWDKYLYQVISQYNRTPHSETSKAPVDYFVQDSEINVPSKPYWKAPRNFTPFSVGDLVLRRTPYQPAGETNKLGPRFQGPLKIIQADANGVTYKAQYLAGEQKIVQIHISQMKAFRGTWKNDPTGEDNSEVFRRQNQSQEGRKLVSNCDVFQLDYGIWANIPIDLDKPRVDAGNMLPSPPEVVENLNVSAGSIPVGNGSETPSEESGAGGHEVGDHGNDYIVDQDDLHLNDLLPSPLSSPTVSDVVSDECLRGGVAATPLQRITEPPPERRITRSMARAREGAPPEKKRIIFSDSDSSEQYFSNASEED